MKSLSLIAYSALITSLVIWAAIIFGSLQLIASAQSRAEQSAALEQEAAKKAYTSRLAALASDTKEQRANLERLVQPDVITIVNTIESAGKSTGVDAQVTSALPEGDATDLPGGGKVQSVGFVVEARGAFPALMRTAALYETLPLPSSIEGLDIEKVVVSGSSSAGTTWHLTIRIRVFTSAPVTS